MSVQMIRNRGYLVLDKLEVELSVIRTSLVVNDVVTRRSSHVCKRQVVWRTCIDDSTVFVIEDLGTDMVVTAERQERGVEKSL